MEVSHAYAIAMKPWCLANVHTASMLNPLTMCHNKPYNLTPSHGLNLEANLRRAPLRYRRTLFSSLRSCKAISDDSRRAVTGESILMNKKTLEKELEMAIEQENYGEAARIRDKIRLLQEDSESAVLAANARFYNAFRAGDLSSMQELWAKGDDVCCVHPGAGGISGYDLVMRSWEYVWVDHHFPLDFEIKDVRVHVKGDIGYVTCMELVKAKGGTSWGRQFATNVFEKIDGNWFISIHHASPIDL